MLIHGDEYRVHIGELTYAFVWCCCLRVLMRLELLLQTNKLQVSSALQAVVLMQRTNVMP